MKSIKYRDIDSNLDKYVHKNEEINFKIDSTAVHSFTPDFKLRINKEIKEIIRPKLCENLSEAIGLTPTVRLNNLGDECKNHHLYLKLESCNPGGSIKEKNAVYLINEAEKSGKIVKGGTIIESSSGNFGIGLAMVGAAKGYRVIIVIDAKTPPPIRRMLSAYGAQLEEVPLSAVDKNGSMQVARMEKAKDLAQKIPDSWYVCQHLNPQNPIAHEIYTAKEIEVAFDGAPDVIVVGVSTAGQIKGLTDYFCKKYPQIQFVGVDVAGSAILGTPTHAYKMTGLGLSFVPPAFHPRFLEAAYSVSDQLAFSMCHALSRKEGLLLGASTGAIVAAGLHFASTFSSSKKILMINPDRGDRYLETVYDLGWLEAQGIKLLKGNDLDLAIRQLHLIPKAALVHLEQLRNNMN